MKSKVHIISLFRRHTILKINFIKLTTFKTYISYNNRTVMDTMKTSN